MDEGFGQLINSKLNLNKQQKMNLHNFIQPEFLYADTDLNAYSLIKERIAEVGGRRGLVSYSQLVTGIVFTFPNVRDGGDYKIITSDWTGLDRAIIGEYLAKISIESYNKADFFAGALVVRNVENQPSDVFFEWMHELGFLRSLTENAVLAFWADQVKRAHEFYKDGVL